MYYPLFILFGFVLTAYSWLRTRYALALGLIFFVCAMMFAGARGASNDYEQYVTMFGNVAASTLAYPARLYIGKDPLFGALILAIHAIGLGPQWLFVASAAIALFLKSKAFVRVFGSFLTPLFATVCLTYFLHEFTQIRVAIALGFSFMALVELCYGKRVLWAIYMAAAVGFHASALVVIVFELPFAIGVRRDIWLAVLAVVTLMAVALMGDFLSIVSSIEDRASAYIGAANVSNNALIVASFKLMALTFLTKFLTRRETDLPRCQLLKICYLLECVGFVFFLIFMNRASGFGFRVYEMLDAFSVFIVAAALLRRTTLCWGTAMCYCIAMLIILSMSKLLLPYQLASSSLW